MSEPEARPAPLRVPVAEVTTRTSLVSDRPRTRGAAAARSVAPEATGPVVVQRPVRYISDPPPPPSPSAPPAVVSVPPPAAAPSMDVAEAEPSRPAEPPPAAPVPEPESEPPVAKEALNGSHEPTLFATGAPAESTPAPDLARSYASLEVESIDPLELADDVGYEDEEVGGDDLGDEEYCEDEDGDPHVLEMSTPPPPAPPEALRRSRPSNDVEIVISPEEEEPSRPSGEFEELEMESDAPASAADEAVRSLPPPPPPPNRVSIPEPPDLKTLTRTARVQELRPSKPRAHPWWEVFFDDDYLRTVRPPTREQVARQCDFIQKRMGLKPGATVLDVGCGLGLSVIELTARGYLGVGLDLSLAMLSRASEEAQARGMRINFLHADMRDMNFEGNFDAVICVGTTLGYFDDDSNRKVIERLHRALKPGGVLLLDVVNRDHVIRSQPNLIWFEGDGCVCMEESEFNFFTSRLHIKRTVIVESGRQLEHEYSLRLYSLHELGQILHSTGFRVTEVSGRDALPGVFFGQESPNLMVIAERRPAGEAGGKEVTGKHAPITE